MSSEYYQEPDKTECYESIFIKGIILSMMKQNIYVGILTCNFLMISQEMNHMIKVELPIANTKLEVNVRTACVSLPPMMPSLSAEEASPSRDSTAAGWSMVTRKHCFVHHLASGTRLILVRKPTTCSSDWLQDSVYFF